MPRQVRRGTTYSMVGFCLFFKQCEGDLFNYSFFKHSHIIMDLYSAKNKTTHHIVSYKATYTQSIS